MKKILSLAVLTLVIAVSAMADKKVVYNTKKGAVTFDHKAHQDKTECTACHGQEPPAKIVIRGKQAHALCLGCHKQARTDKISGSCGECHKK
jgi:predicted CXXCH cytochrome family protein